MSTPAIAISENKSDGKENDSTDDPSFPKGFGKYNNTQCGWLEKRSKFVKKWRARFCVLKMSHCLMITYKYQFDQVTSTKALNDKKNQTDSILFGDISCVQEIEFNINGEEYDYNNKKKLEKSTEWYGFKVFINRDIPNEEIIENKKHIFQCQYEGFDLQTIKYQKKDFDSYLFRCKNKYAMREWVDLIQDCIIRAKYYNCQRSIQAKLTKINTFAVITDNKEREIKYYRLLLGLPHNQKITILWEKLGFALSMKQEKDMNAFNLCCNAFETAHSLNKNDSKILYNFITALDNFNNIDIFTKNRISKTLMIYNRIQKLYNDKSMDYYGFCKFLYSNTLYKLLENVLNKLVSSPNNGNLDPFIVISYFNKLIHHNNMDGDDNDDNHDNNNNNNDNNDKWKYLLKIKKCYQLKAKQQDIEQWDVSQIIEYINILIQLKHNQQALMYINLILEKNPNHKQALKLKDKIKDDKSNANENDDNKEEMEDIKHENDLYNFLSDTNVDLLQYYDIFIENKLANLNQILNINKQQLIEMNITNSHQTKILHGIENMKNKQLVNSPSIDLP